MLIDWFTVGAQGINFLILVWLMKRYLYKPVLHAIDAREKRIAAELADANSKQAEALAERDLFRQKNEEFDQQRAALVKQATDEASAERRRLIEQAHETANTVSAKRDETLRNEARNLNQAIVQRAQHEVFAIARKTLVDLADASLEERIGEVFIGRLRDMDEPARERLAESIRTMPGPALVRSAFDLPAALREKIQHSLNEALSAEVSVHFEAGPELVSGIELTANGQKVAWSIAEYLRALEKGVGELVQKEDQAELKPRPQAAPPSGSRADTDHEPVATAKAASA